ncbi:MAG: VWA domain-containing protein [Planctomycetes bacterium]|nr:VWA domain-containing protein [Planctomycetota bacterium]
MPVTSDFLIVDSVLAFGWGAPWLLWWIGLASAPIIIHLLSRKRHREMEWAAMRFLLDAMRKNSRRLQMEQLILLAVRALILILVVLALAQIRFDSPAGLFDNRQPVHTILVIDCSASMGYTSQSESLFERARQTARRIVEQAQPGDVFNLVRLANLPPAVIIPDLAYEPAHVIEEVDLLSVTHGTADLGGSLQAVPDLLKLAPEITNKVVYVISDFQRTSWGSGPGGDSEVARMKPALKQIEAGSRLVLIDVGEFSADNVAITSLEIVDGFATTVRPATVRASIRNFGTERVTGRQLELLVDDKLVEQRTLDLAAGVESVEVFLVPFAAGGEHRIQARLQKDALALDDERWLAVTVRDQIRVLCVNGGSARSTAGRATDYLELALSPGRFGSRGGSAERGRIEPTIINDGEFQGFDLSGYDCVFFCNVRRFTPREAVEIEAFLQGGGGVVWCLGDQVSVDTYNEVLFRQGTGCLPARLGDRVGDPQVRDLAFGFDPRDFEHPIVRPFQGNPEAGLERTQTYAYLQASIPAAKDSRVALAFDSGDPAIVDMPFGRGRSILVTTAVDEQWGIWPLWPSFLPLVHEILHYALTVNTGDRQKLVGDSFQDVMAAGTFDSDVTVLGPDGQSQPVRTEREDAILRFTTGPMKQCGIYHVSTGRSPGKSSLFAVNLDPRESQLAKLTREELADDALAGGEFSYQTNWTGETERGPALAGPSPHSAVSRWLLYVLLYVMFTEQVLAWDFRKGLWLLCPVVPLLSRVLGRG